MIHQNLLLVLHNLLYYLIDMYSDIVQYASPQVVLRPRYPFYSKVMLSPSLLLIHMQRISMDSAQFYHQDCFCIIVITPTFSSKSAPSSIDVFLLFSESSTLVHRPKHQGNIHLQPPWDKLGHVDRYHCCKSRIRWMTIQIEAILEDGVAAQINRLPAST